MAVDVGDYVTPGDRAVKLVQLEELDLALAVPGSVATTLSRGQAIELDIPDQPRRTGRIVALAAAPDPVTHTYDLRIRLAGQDLYPGQLVAARLPGRKYTDAHVVPASAILRDDGQTYVFAVADDQLRRLPVTVRQRYREDWQMVDGVDVGTTIVARDVAALADGQTVSVQ